MVNTLNGTTGYEIVIQISSGSLVFKRCLVLTDANCRYIKHLLWVKVLQVHIALQYIAVSLVYFLNATGYVSV